VTGLISFTHLLSWLLHRFHQLTLAVLTGFMVGSLAKVWPWKHLRNEGDGMQEFNVWPNQFQVLQQQDPQVLLVLAMLCLGIATVYTIDRFGNARAGS
jgi:putative membrane protein